jgi:FkbM family methyltransferase
MQDDIIKYNNLYFPKKQEHLEKIRNDILVTSEVGPRYVSQFCKNKKTVVQAGGWCGIYPQIYSEIFETVYTFEPDPVNFYCLVQNVKNSNVMKFQSCLGADHTLVSVKMNEETARKKGHNTGTFQVTGEGKVPVLKIDDLALTACDLIHLDIEGFEGFALQGAMETIRKFKPVICLEINGLGKQYGWGVDEIYKFLESIDYKFEIKTESDDIFLPNSTKGNIR